jgi:hypothetical protein
MPGLIERPFVPFDSRPQEIPLVVRTFRIINHRGGNMHDIVKIRGFESVIPDTLSGIVLDLHEVELPFPLRVDLKQFLPFGLCPY